MRKDKSVAQKLRESGQSYRDIEKTMNIPRSTLSEWFKEEEWSLVVKEKLDRVNLLSSTERIQNLNRVRGKRLEDIYNRARNEAREELQILKYHPLFVSGMMLFWGEGTKTIKSQVRVTNTDPNLLRVFVNFLKEIISVPEEGVRASLLLYPDLDENQCRIYWAEALGISERFIARATFIEGRHKTKRLHQGVCTVYVSSTYLKVKMMEWLKLLPEELLKRQYYANI